MMGPVASQFTMIDLSAELKGSYEITSTAEPFTFKIIPTTNWSYFHGHFPGMAILPAVGIVDISRYFIETYIQKEKNTLKKIGFFKIKTPVLPEQAFIISIQKDASKKFQVSWKNEIENSASAEFSIELI